MKVGSRTACPRLNQYGNVVHGSKRVRKTTWRYGTCGYGMVWGWKRRRKSPPAPSPAGVAQAQCSSGAFKWQCFVCGSGQLCEGRMCGARARSSVMVVGGAIPAVSV